MRERRTKEEPPGWSWLRQSPPAETAADYIQSEACALLEFSSRDRPAVLKGCTKDWAAKHKWSSGELLGRHYGTAVFTFADGTVRTLNQYLEYATENTSDNPDYLVERVFDGERQALLGDYTVPLMFDDDLLAYVPGSRRARYWFVGGQRTGTFLHVDPMCTSAWNTCTLGLKRWCFLPPETDLSAFGLEPWTQGKFQKRALRENSNLFHVSPPAGCATLLIIQPPLHPCHLLISL